MSFVDGDEQLAVGVLIPIGSQSSLFLITNARIISLCASVMMSTS